MAIMPRKDTIADDKRGGDAQTIVTVKDIAALPALSQAKQAIEGRGADRAVMRVVASEPPDALPPARPGDLLLLGADAVRDHAERIRAKMAEWAQQGAAAVAVAANAAAAFEAAGCAEEADRQGLPLLVMPIGLSLPDAARVIADRLMDQETARLADLHVRMRSVTQLLLEGRGLHAFLDSLESMLGNPVAIVREYDKPWLSDGLRASEAAESWPLLQALTYRHLGRAADGGFALLQNAYRAYVAPIPHRKPRSACLVLLERHRPLQPIDALSLDRFAVPAGLELANAEAVREVEGQYVDRFLQDWLSGKIVSEADWRMRADVCGCAVPDGATLVAALVGWSAGVPDAEALKELARRVRLERLRSASACVAAPVGDELAIVLTLEASSGQPEESDDAQTASLEGLLAELRQLLGDKELRLFAGRPVSRPEALGGSWLQAKRARQAAEVCGLEGSVVQYDRLGVYALLYLIPHGEEKEQFLRRYAAPLQQADRKGGGRLVETLEMFFRCNGNIKLTSEQLFAHYNTVVYRLDKIQSILEVDLDDPEDRLRLQLALKLGQIHAQPPAT